MTANRLTTTDPDGVVSGRDPRTISPAEFDASGIWATPVLDAIKAKCVDCSGGSRHEAMLCVAIKCPLWPFRAGTNPFRAKRELSDEQRRAAADRLSAARLRKIAETAREEGE